MIAVGVFWAVQQFGQSLQGLWLSLIGVFLFSTATISYRQEKRRESLRPYRVADAFRADWISLPAETALGSPLVSHNLRLPDAILGVISQDRIVGIVTGRDLAKNPASSSPFTTLAQIMAPMSSYPIVGPADGLYEALERMESEGLDRLAVVHDGRLMGFLSMADARALIFTRPKNRF